MHRIDNSQAHCSAQITHRWSDEGELEQITFAGDNSTTLQYFGNIVVDVVVGVVVIRLTHRHNAMKCSPWSQDRLQ